MKHFRKYLSNHFVFIFHEQIRTSFCNHSRKQCRVSQTWKMSPNEMEFLAESRSENLARHSPSVCLPLNPGSGWEYCINRGPSGSRVCRMFCNWLRSVTCCDGARRLGHRPGSYTANEWPGNSSGRFFCYAANPQLDVRATSEDG